MKAAIFNPYLDTLGGGERYTMAVAQTLLKNGYKVDLEWKDKAIIKKLENRFGISLQNLSAIDDVNRGDGYDVCFWLSDGSIPALKSRKNFLHFQIPFQDVNGKTLINKMKLFRVRKVICNSVFTKKFVDREYGVDSVVLYPPVDTEKFKSKRKENIILYVGRFSTLTQLKGQDILIKNFKSMVKNGLKDWELVLAGGIEIGANKNIVKLKKLAKGFPVKIIESPSFKELKGLFGISKIFWSAAGYGVNEMVNPAKVEHFGITVVEGMSSGVVPIAYSAGGHKETVRSGKNGFLWGKDNDLIEMTKSLIDNPKLLREMAIVAKQSSQKYSYERFEENFLALL